MSLTIFEADRHIAHALGGNLVGIDQRRILDEAGRKLLSLRGWNWARRPSTTLTLTSAQSYITLPVDFGSIVAIEYTSTSWNRVRQVTIPDIARMRSESWPSSDGIYVAPTFSVDSDGIPSPRLEVYPTPTATSAGALTLNYSIRWPDMSVADENFIPVPDWMESVYIQLVRATAWGYQDDTMSDRVARVVSGPEWFAAVRMDESLQPMFGPLRGGMTSRDADWYGMDYLRTAAAAPS